MKLQTKPAHGQNIFQKARVDRSDLIHLFDAQVFNDVTSEVNSLEDGAFAAVLPSGGWDGYDLFLNLDSDNTPTDLEFFVEFSPDGGTTWFHNAQDMFASLIYDDTVVASGLRQVFRGEVAGAEMRLRAIGTGLSSSNTFTFSAFIQFKRR